jgi:hypothetical protein
LPGNTPARIEEAKKGVQSVKTIYKYILEINDAEHGPDSLYFESDKPVCVGETITATSTDWDNKPIVLTDPVLDIATKLIIKTA